MSTTSGAMTADGTSPTNSSNNSKLGYSVEEILLGVLVSEECPDYGQKLAGEARRLFPDRLRVVVLDHHAEDTNNWSKVDVLLLGCLKGAFPHSKANAYLEQHHNNATKKDDLVVLTDLDWNRNRRDRRHFYNLLAVGGLTHKLPRNAYVNRDGLFGDQVEDNGDIVDRRDQLQVHQTILLKPVLERPVDPSDPEVRIYYPRSQGGGCKILTFDADDNVMADFKTDVRSIRKDATSSYIYEELVDVPGVVRRPPRKRDIVRSLVTGSISSHPESLSFGDEDQVSYESDLARPDRKIVIVTTASLPWMTGTAVNPLLRAAYLLKKGQAQKVTLVVPWLDDFDDQAKVYGTKRFATPLEQEDYVRAWLRESASMPEEADPEKGIQILWYPSQYVAALGSIFPKGDICSLVKDEDADVCILEEPEHLNWLRPEGEGEIWTEKFSHVVGVIHTNYRAYASQVSVGLIAAPFVTGISTLMVRAYCDKVIKLSATLQTYAPEKEVVCNVHGVRSDFLLEGKRRAEEFQDAVEEEDDETPKAYFIGKLLWEKGLDHLLRLEYFYKQVTGDFFPIDIVGDGPDREAIENAFNGETKRAKVEKLLLKLLAIDEDDTGRPPDGSDRNLVVSSEAVEVSEKQQQQQLLSFPTSMFLRTGNIPSRFHGRQDHAHFCSKYKVIVNPSVTEVLCTTVAEALAMGKFAVIPKHPSNEFFLQFRNCLVYENKVEFVEQLAFALANEPEPMSEAESHVFSWEAATDRLVRSSAITMHEGRQRAKARKDGRDKHIAKTYNKLGILRSIFQGGGRRCGGGRSSEDSNNNNNDSAAAASDGLPTAASTSDGGRDDNKDSEP